MDFETVNVTPLRRRFSKEIRVRTYMVLPVFAFILWVATFQAQQYEVSIFFVCLLVLFFVINHGVDWGYQVATDGIRIFQRPKGWRWFFRRLRWHSIRHDEITKMETIFGADGAIKQRFFPFEFILIYGVTGKDGDNVVIYPSAFKDVEIKKFLFDLFEYKPSIFPKDVIEYMNSDKPM